MRKESTPNKELILQEGWLLFQQKGYRGVSTDELCERCSITKPTLYYYFQDKENLFVQILTRKLQGLHQGLNVEGDFTQRLSAFTDALLTNFQTGYSVLVHDRTHIKKVENQTAVQTAFRSELFDPLMQLMQTGIQEGALQPANTEFLTLVYLGIVNNFLGRENNFDLEQSALIELLVNQFINGSKKK